MTTIETTATATVPLLNPAAVPELGELRLEGAAITEALSAFGEDLWEVRRRVENFVVRVHYAKEQAANVLLHEMVVLDDLVAEDDLDPNITEGVRLLIDATTGLDNMWMLLKIASDVIHPEVVMKAAASGVLGEVDE